MELDTLSKKDNGQNRVGDEPTQLALGLFFEHSVDLLVFIGFDGRLKRVSPSFERILGWKTEEVLSKPFIEFVYPDDREKSGAKARTRERGQEAIRFENRYLCNDGSYRWISWNSRPLLEERIIVGIGRDITERKKAEEALKRQAALIDLSPDAIMVRSLDGTISFWSEGAERLYGYSKQEALGKISNELLKTKFPMPEAEIGAQIKRSGQWSGELIHKTKSGLEVVVQSRWLIEKITSENISVLESNIDITERKKAEEKLRDSKVWEATSLYTRNLIEASLDPLVTISAEGKITDVNKATENATGCSRKQLIGSDFSNYFTEPEKAAAGYKHVFTEGFVMDYPLSIRHKSGKIIEVIYNASIYRNAEGQVQGVFAAARDITERKNLEKQLHDKERLAAIGATAGMVGHDIRNPLQAITSDVYLAKNELATAPDSEGKKNALESMEEIEKNIDYINKIVQDLQDYARPLNPRPEESDLTKIVAKLFKKNGLPTNIELSVKLAPEAIKINADSYYLNRIIFNLVTNSVQAMPKGGKLTIQAFKDAKDIVILFKDTGVGIPNGIQSKMFIPMFTTKSKGQGFGLPVVKRMTESLGGTVTFESQEGKGTTFTVRLPPQEQNGKFAP